MTAETVLVVGAGASCEAGLPSGAELKVKIQNALSVTAHHFSTTWTGDAAVNGALMEYDRAHNLDTGARFRLAMQICDAMPLASSIDNYMDSHRDDKRLAAYAKCAIVKCILDAERSSKMYLDPHGSHRYVDFQKLSKSWFNPFWQILTENCTAAMLPERLARVAVVSFNYDRCVEHFVYHAIRSYYRLDDRESARIAGSLRVLHPYGSVGALQWSSGGMVHVGFGAEVDSLQLLKISSGIRTFMEGQDEESGSIADIHGVLSAARTLLFMGFAFHRMNMELLRLPNGLADGCLMESRMCFSTGQGLSDHDRDLVASQIQNDLLCDERRVVVRDLACAGLFAEYARSLSLVPRTIR